VQYTPANGYTGPDSFTFKATDADSVSSTPATASITVNATPACTALSPSTVKGQALAIQLACTGGTSPLTYAVASQPANGTLSGLNTATGAVTYTPNTGYTGPDQFTYHATDAAGVTATTATVSITVTQVPPTCSNVSATTSAGTAVSIQLTCTDSAGRVLSYAIAGPPAHGATSAFNSATGALTYTPAAGFSGADTFTFNATAGGQSSNTATVTITVNAPAGGGGTGGGTGGGGTGGGGTGGGGGTTTGLTSFSPSHTALVVKGLVSIQVTFTGNGTGTITLTVGAHGASASAKKKKPTVIGTARFTLSGKGAATIHVRLNSAGNKLLRQHKGKLTATAKMTFTGNAHAPITFQLALKSSKKKK
jgi:hypothetical protein